MRFGHLIIRTMNFFRLMRRAGNFGLGRESCKRIEGISYAESLFQKQSEDCIREMVMNHKNHPCIFVWGILNECASETLYGRDCYTKQYRQLEELDRTRPRTSASNKHKMISAWIYRRLYLSICIRSGIAIRMRRRWTAYRI